MASPSTFIGLWRDAKTRNRPFGTTDDSGRIFIACADCRRVIPVWRVVGHRAEVVGQCPSCGHGDFKPRQIPNWKAAWWVLVRGWLIRRVLQGKTNDWDPRISWRQKS
jgi:hypothetical protein